MNRDRRRKRSPVVPPEYRPDFPWFVKWIWVGILVVPILVSVIIQITG